MPLDLEIRAFLDEQAAGAKPRDRMTVEETRAFALGFNRWSGAPPAGVTAQDYRVPSAAGDIPLRLYQPTNARGGASACALPRPLLLYFHGGRFISGSLDSHDTVCRQLAQLSGCLLAAVDYRLAPEHPFPAALEDAYAAAVWAAGHALRLGADPARIGVGGDSAGANLAAALSLLIRRRGGPQPACQMLIYPMIDATCSLPSHRDFASGYGPGSADMRRGWQAYLGPDGDPTDPLASPLHAADPAGLPPAFILTAEFDSLRDEGELYAARLRDAGVPVETLRLQGAIHGVFQMAGRLQAGRRAVDAAAAYLRRAL